MTSPTSGWDVRGAQGQPLTPDRVRKVEFSKAPLTRRGYNEEEVHFFQYRVADAIAAADSEKAKLRVEIERMKDYFREHGVVVESDGQQPARPDIDAASVEMMSRAQQSADTHIAQAEDYARRIVADARQQYEEILQQAQQQASAAAEKAREAQQAASAETPGHVDRSQQEQLEQHITYLRTFAEVTQAQLKSVLEGLTREIDKLEGLPREHDQR